MDKILDFITKDFLVNHPDITIILILLIGLFIGSKLQQKFNKEKLEANSELVKVNSERIKLLKEENNKLEKENAKLYSKLKIQEDKC